MLSDFLPKLFLRGVFLLALPLHISFTKVFGKNHGPMVRFLQIPWYDCVLGGPCSAKSMVQAWSSMVRLRTVRDTATSFAEAI